MAVGGVLLYLYDKEMLFAAVNTRHTPFRDVVMFQISRLGEGGVIAAVLLALWLTRYFRNAWFFLSALLCTAVPALVVQALKRSFEHPRPLNFFNEAAWIHVHADWPRYYHHSFPSGHAAGAFSFFCFLACLLPARYRGWGLVLFLLAMMVACSRLYFADVYVGSIVGTGVMLTAFAVMRHYMPRFFRDHETTVKIG
jgi:membrane-associated phospholipid phosphatase